MDARRLAQQRARYHKDPVRFRRLKSVNARRRYHLLREAILLALGGRCARCRTDDQQVLQIDHKHGGGNQERRRFSSPGQYMRHVLRWLPRYQILCANCNFKKRLRFETQPSKYR